jgi:hypothetical protein
MRSAFRLTIEDNARRRGANQRFGGARKMDNYLFLLNLSFNLYFLEIAG